MDKLPVGIGSAERRSLDDRETRVLAGETTAKTGGVPAEGGDARVVLVTGGTDGIGRAVALHLARAGHRVLITGRDHDRGAEVVRQIKQAAKPRSGADRTFTFLPADLSSMADTLALADRVGDATDRLDGLAGGTQFANDVLTVELASRYSNTNLEVTCVNPGIVATDLFRHAPGLPLLVSKSLARLAARVGQPPNIAALTPAWLAAHPDAIGVSGRFFGPHRTPIRVPDRVWRPERRSEIWHTSKELLRPLAD